MEHLMKRLASSLVAIAAFAACSDSPASPPRSLSADSPAASVSSAAVTARSGQATVVTVAALNQPVVQVINVGPITTHPTTIKNSAATISLPPTLTAKLLNAGVQTK